MGPTEATGAGLLAGRYRVVRRLGTGGMASVYLAEDRRLGRLVAVKRLRTDSPTEALKRFRREARIGALLNHPNIVSIYDSIAEDDAVLIVMEYVDGTSLADLVREGPVPPDRAIPVLRQIADALDHAHARGVIHRDVKPSNVLVRDDGVAKLADLGIATASDATAITQVESVIGTLAYIAPERLNGKTDHPAADIYALAAVAYEALSGKRAQRGTTPVEVIERAESERPPDLRQDWAQAPLEAAAALRDGLSPDPRRRPSSAVELIDRLDAGLAGKRSTGSTATRPTTVLPRARRPSRLGFIAALLGLAAIGLALGLIAGGGGDGGGTERLAGAGKAQRGSQRGQRPAAQAETNTQSSTTEKNPPPRPPQSGAALGASLNAQGFTLMQEGRYEEAIPILQRAVDAFPSGTADANYAYALFNLGSALRLAGRADEAIPILEQRLRIPNQTATVQRELDLARAATGAAPEPTSGEGPKTGKGPKPGKGPKHGAGGTEAAD